MKDVVLNEIKSELNLKEKIVAIVFKKTYNKIYQLGVQRGFKWNNVDVR